LGHSKFPRRRTCTCTPQPICKRTCGRRGGRRLTKGSKTVAVGRLSPKQHTRKSICFQRVGEVAEWLKAPHSKFVGGRPDPFRSVPTSIDLFWKNRPRVQVGPVENPFVLTRSRPFW